MIVDSTSFAYSNRLGNFEIVCAYRKAGLNVMPLRIDGSKAPKIKWRSWQHERVPSDLLSTHFRNRFNPSGIGVICGVSSGNLEILDFDNPTLFTPWCEAIGAEENLVVVGTPSGGRHVLWRCPVIAGNQGLAWSETGDIWIETRGQGGQAVLPGSPPATHVSRIEYKLLRGNLLEIPTITVEQRDAYLNAARRFNRKTPKITAKEFYGFEDDDDGRSPSGDRPGDDFNARASWGSILEPMGWTVEGSEGPVTLWCRPNKPEGGHSATTGYCGDCLYVFSTSAAPFEANTSYTKFGAYAVLYHNGDFEAAAHALQEKGFGISARIADYEQQIKQLYRGKDNG